MRGRRWRLNLWWPILRSREEHHDLLFHHVHIWLHEGLGVSAWLAVYRRAGSYSEFQLYQSSLSLLWYVRYRTAGTSGLLDATTGKQ